ncbi:MAG: hypothetical protein IT435_10805 [Phycisphaerales bacterium]|nr:hypothetical protein [Phycisphaerales bacterium]
MSYSIAPATPRVRTLVLWTLLGVSLLCPGVRYAQAHSRQDALFIGQYYNAATMDITAANVYPAVPCYKDSLQLRPKLGVGHYTGAVYSFRDGNPKSVFTIIDDISIGRGAGNFKLLNEQKPSCVAAFITGIDCSQYVSAAWRVPRFGTWTLSTSGQATPLDVDCPECVKPGDAFNDVGSHIVLFAESISLQPGPFFGWFFSYEAWGGGRCVTRSHDYYADAGIGYRPWVAKVLKDDPASQISAFDVTPTGTAVAVRWSTLLEDRTESFSIWRAASAGGPFELASPSIPAVGGSSIGAMYEWLDTAPPEGAVYYRLEEREVGGRVLRHGVRSLAEARAWLQKER